MLPSLSVTIRLYVPAATLLRNESVVLVSCHEYLYGLDPPETYAVALPVDWPEQGGLAFTTIESTLKGAVSPVEARISSPSKPE